MKINRNIRKKLSALRNYKTRLKKEFFISSRPSFSIFGWFLLLITKYILENSRTDRLFRLDWLGVSGESFYLCL